MSRIVDFAKTELGLTLRPGQAQMVADFEQGSYNKAVWQCGRRGGKSLLADTIALFDATTRDHLREYLMPGEPRVTGIVAPRLDQAAQHIARCGRLARNSERLASMIVNETTEELAFKNGSVIRAYPASARGLRGDPWSCAILDELGHFITSDDGNAAGDRILEAVQPSTAQFGNEGWLAAISTPLWRQGAFWKLVERAKSGRFERMHYVHKSTFEMNPSISADFLEEQRREDPELYGREYLAEFIDGASSYLTSADVIACRRSDNILPPSDHFRYVGALDPAYTLDNFAMAVAHSESDKRIVIDGCWTWRKYGHDATLTEVAEIARRYRITSLRTDQASAVPIREGLARHGIDADYRPWTSETKVAAFTALKMGLNSRSVELPNDAALIEELVSLEARPTPNGSTRIAAASSGHDDRAVAVASCVHAIDRPSGPAIIFVDMDENDSNPWTSNRGWEGGIVSVG